MAITGKQLADGQLPNAEAALYTVPGSTTTYIKSIILHNTDASSHTCTLKMQPSGGTARVIADVALSAGYVFYFDEAIVLDAGDAIRGDDGAGGGIVVDYTIYGVEQT